MTSFPNSYYQPQDYREYLNKKFKSTDYSQALKPPTPPTTPQAGEGGFNVGGAISAGTTGLALVGNAIGMAQTDLNVPNSAPTVTDTYQGGYYADVNNAKVQKTSVGEVGGAMAQGAAAGAAFGGVGAVIGAGVGAITSLIGGRRRRKRQQDQKRKASRQVADYQAQFNEQSKINDQQEIALSDYQKRLNNQYRLNNLYS